MKYLQDNKDKSLSFDIQLYIMLNNSLHKQYKYMMNNPRCHNVFSELNNRIYTMLRSNLNIMTRYLYRL